MARLLADAHTEREKERAKEALALFDAFYYASAALRSKAGLKAANRWAKEMGNIVSFNKEKYRKEQEAARKAQQFKDSPELRRFGL